MTVLARVNRLIDKYRSNPELTVEQLWVAVQAAMTTKEEKAFLGRNKTALLEVIGEALREKARKNPETPPSETVTLPVQKVIEEARKHVHVAEPGVQLNIGSDADKAVAQAERVIGIDPTQYNRAEAYCVIFQEQVAKKAPQGQRENPDVDTSRHQGSETETEYEVRTLGFDSGKYPPSVFSRQSNPSSGYGSFEYGEDYDEEAELKG